ncbi:ABC transporter ATPase component [compost metagenome]
MVSWWELLHADGTLLFTSHDHQFIQTIANRIVEITPNGVIDRVMTYDEYLESDEVKQLRERMYPVEVN